MSVNRPPSAASCPHRAAPSTQKQTSSLYNKRSPFSKEGGRNKPPKSSNTVQGERDPLSRAHGRLPPLYSLTSPPRNRPILSGSPPSSASFLYVGDHRTGGRLHSPHTPAQPPRIFLLLSHTHSQWCRPGTCGMGPLFLGNCITCSLH